MLILQQFQDGQPAQAVIDTNLRFGYAANVGLTTLLSYLVNVDSESEDSVAKAGVAVQLVMDKFCSGQFSLIRRQRQSHSDCFCLFGDS